MKTAAGMRPIEAIEQGDMVYAGDGALHPVLLTHVRPFAGELVRVICAPFKVPILLTPNHKVPVLRPRSKRMEQVPAGDLRPQNYLVYPAICRVSEPLSWAIRDGWDMGHGPRPRPLPEDVDVAAFAEWLGWYLAEGSVSIDRIVRFSLGADERAYAERLKELTAIVFPGSELRMAVAGTRLELWLCHALLGRWLKYQCGPGARNKRVPSFVWQWSSHQQWLLFRALMLGDGSIRREPVLVYGRLVQSGWVLQLAAPSLIDDVRDLLLHNGVVPTAVRSQHAVDGRLSWSLSVPADVERRWGARGPIERVPVRIRKIERVAYEGLVHNLTVADEHTYVTFSGTVCNCGATGDVIQFVIEREGCSFLEACERLAERGRPPLRHDLGPRPAARAGRCWETIPAESPEGRVLDLASQVYQEGLARSRRAQAYLRGRGVPDTQAADYQLGYADGHALLGRLERGGLLATGLDLGLVVERPPEPGPGPRYREFFADRVIVPELRGARAIWFIGRAAEEGPTRRPKYLSLPGQRPLLGAEAVAGQRVVYVVEGPFDWLAARAWGLAACCLCGTHTPPERLPALERAVAVYGVLDP
ncbi:MAG: hypothetical protein JO023_02775, partial [Chloroflexi bacterium]|nr:hypothetical protein [Chloroflexota bacterium]